MLYNLLETTKYKEIYNYCRSKIWYYKQYNKKKKVKPTRLYELNENRNMDIFKVVYCQKIKIFVPKRTMFRTIGQTIYHNEPRFIHRNMATWNVCSRITEAQYKIAPPLKIIDGYEVMHACDFSGKNHYLLTDRDYKNSWYYKIYGSFTTSTTPYKNVHPCMVSSFTLEGHNKPQFLHLYPKPRLILKNEVEISDLGTHTLGYKEYEEFLKNIKTEDETI